jgi:hypothetical protein
MTTTAPTERPRAERHARGKRPHFYDVQGLDEAMSMILVLVQEVAVLRDRIDAGERVMKKHGIDLAAEIESLPLDQEALEAREQRRGDLLDRVFYVTKKQAEELKQQDTAERYHAVIEDIAKN